LLDFVIVGSGLFGLTLAERIANILEKEVLVLETREHIGGNAWSEYEQTTGIEVHKYGSHLFHTNNEKVWSYISQFTEFNNYQHRVWTKSGSEVFQMPINLSTIRQFYQLDLTPSDAKELVMHEISGLILSENDSFESRALRSIGRPLYEKFIRGYTQKQWQTDPSNLPPEVFTRLPVRFNFDSRYFEDKFQGLPANGYADLFSNLVSNSKIKIETGVSRDYFRRFFGKTKNLIYTGPLDEYFNYEFGRLGWRTLDFETEIIKSEDFQGAAVMNYADLEIPYTRIHEFRHLHPERRVDHKMSIIMREFSRFSGRDDEPYYPINSKQDRSLIEKYRKLGAGEANVYFGGRLGTYQYLDMHMAIASALQVFENKIKPQYERIRH